MSIQEMRRCYTMRGLDEKDVDSDPMVQFQRWFHEANQPDNPDWLELNAMTLSTSDGAGGVTSRIVLLKGVEEGRKGRWALEDLAAVALMHRWKRLEDS